MKIIVHHYFGGFTARNHWVVASMHTGAALLGYPARLNERNILSPAECAAMLHFSKAANLLGLAYAASKYLPATESLGLKEVQFVRDAAGNIAAEAEREERAFTQELRMQQSSKPKNQSTQRNAGRGNNNHPNPRSVNPPPPLPTSLAQGSANRIPDDIIEDSPIGLRQRIERGGNFTPLCLHNVA